jgi:hypothetical protein
MSVEVGILRCDSCSLGAGTSMIWGKWRYELPDGTRTKVQRCFGWCYDCQSITPVENFQCLNSLRNEYRRICELEYEIRQGMKGILNWLGLNKGQIKRLKEVTEFRLWQERKLEAYKTMLKSRNSKERCLECSGTNISHLNLPDREECWQQYIPIGFIHPGCGGQIMLGYDGLRFAFSFRKIRIFSPEGVFLHEVDATQPYW